MVYLCFIVCISLFGWLHHFSFDSHSNKYTWQRKMTFVVFVISCCLTYASSSSSYIRLFRSCRMQLIQNTSMFADLLNEIKCTSRFSGVRFCLLWCMKIKHSCSETGDRCENGSCSTAKRSIQVNGNNLLVLLSLV